MDFTAFASHLANFMAPAFWLPLMLCPMARLAFGKAARSRGFFVQWALQFVVGLAVLAAGLLAFGHDGKMTTYAVLVLASASCQWLMLRGWQR